MQYVLLDGYTREIWQKYFECLEKVDGDLIYNFDETGVCIGDTSKLRGKRLVHDQSATDKRHLVYSGDQANND